MRNLFEHLYENRREAGADLGKMLKKHDLKDPVILALPRGGVVVADEVAQSLKAPVEVVIARKIGAPGHPEFGIGAISEDGVPTFNPAVANYFQPDHPAIQQTVKEENEELHRRIQLYRKGSDLPLIEGRDVVVVDDGLATGVTAAAAAKFLRTRNPRRLFLAVPVGPQDVSPEVRENFDEVICPHLLSDLRSVGMWYHDFTQVEDDEVLSILEKYH